MKKARMAVVAALGSIIGGLLNTSCRSWEVLYGPGPDPIHQDTIGEVICLYGVFPVEAPEHAAEGEETPAETSDESAE